MSFRSNFDWASWPRIQTAAICAVVWACAGGAGASWMDDVGYTRLASELGSSVPTGAGITVAQVEARELSTNNFMPDTGNGDFVGKTITDYSGSPGISDHATYVGQYLYGLSDSMAPGITNVNIYEAIDWIDHYLNYQTPIAPDAMTERVMNCSWVGQWSFSGDTEVLRRFDYLLAQNHIFAAVGTNNGSSTTVPDLLAASYNAIVVGLSNGQHAHGYTQVDVLGRVKPDIVAPAGATSWATAMVSSAAALLYQAADQDSRLATARTHPELIKAILMSSASKSSTFPTWNRTSTRPLDDTYGAGQLNVYNAYHLLEAGQHAASSIATVPATGWDYSSVTAGSPLRYYFDITGNSTDELSVILSWNRQIISGGSNKWPYPAATVPNLDLRLYSASGFALGAVVDSSVSTVDNVECIYQTALAPGRYALEVADASGSSPYALAWQSTLTTYLPGDFNHDGVVNAADIDLLYSNFGANAFYDLTGDGVVNQADVNYLVRNILDTNYGDTNLDGKVNFSDFQVLLDNWEKPATWAGGDFTGDGMVNFSDFQNLLDYWNPGGVSAGADGVIPEPATLVLLGLGAIGLIRRKK